MKLEEALERLELRDSPADVNELNSKFEGALDHINVLLQSAPTPVILKKYRSNLELLYTAHEIVYSEVVSSMDEKEAKKVLGILGEAKDDLVESIYKEHKSAYEGGLNDSDRELVHQCKLELLRLDKARNVLLGYQNVDDNSLTQTSGVAAEEAAKKAEEEKRLAEEAEAAKKAEEEKRLAEEAEAAKKAEEEKRLAEEAEAAKKAEEEKRLAEEAEAAKKAEEEKRLAEEAEAAKRAEEEKRLAKEAKAAKKAEEEKRLAEEAKAAKRAEEEKRLAEEAEAAKKVEDEKRTAAFTARSSTSEKSPQKIEETVPSGNANSDSDSKTKEKKSVPFFRYLLIGILVLGIAATSWFLDDLNKAQIDDFISETINSEPEEESQSSAFADSTSTLLPADTSESGSEIDSITTKILDSEKEQNDVDLSESSDFDNQENALTQDEFLTEDSEYIEEIEPTTAQVKSGSAAKEDIESIVENALSARAKPEKEETPVKASSKKEAAKPKKPEKPSEPVSYDSFSFTSLKTIYSEDYTKPKTRFILSSVEDRFQDIHNGAYETRLFGFDEDGFKYTASEVRLDEEKDFMISVEVLYLKGNVFNEMGLVWGAERGSFLMFGINHKGQYTVSQFENRAPFKEFVDRKPCRLIKKGFKNTLSVAKRGNRWFIMINGKVVHTMKYMGMYGYFSGLAIPYNANIRYDNFKVEYIQ